jgi:hypothetical protein
MGPKKGARAMKECPAWLRQALEEEKVAREEHHIASMSTPAARFLEQWTLNRTRMSRQEKLKRLGISAAEVTMLADHLGLIDSEILKLRYDESTQTADPSSWFQPKLPNGEPILLRNHFQLMDHLLGRRHVLSTRLYVEVTARSGRTVSVRNRTRSLRLDFDTGRIFDAVTIKEAFHFVSSRLHAHLMPFRSSSSMGIYGDLPLGRWWDAEPVNKFETPVSIV